MEGSVDLRSPRQWPSIAPLSACRQGSHVFVVVLGERADLLGVSLARHRTMSNRHITWHPRPPRAEQRDRAIQVKPLTVWLTGLSGAGKSTVAYGLEAALDAIDHRAFVLDGDNVRHGLNKDLGFSRKDRLENIRRVAEVARLFNDAGLIAIVAFISPYEEDRKVAREIVGHERFFEVFVSATLECCEQRDPKGLYAKARAGLLPDFTGVSAPYDAPKCPELVLDTTRRTADECVAILMASLTGCP